MKKGISIIGMMVGVVLCFFLVTVLPCWADDVVCGCAKIKTGTFRIIDCGSQCKTSEFPVTLSGTSQQNQNPIPNFEGTMCWIGHKTENEDGAVDETYLMKMGITYHGGDYYIVQGMVNASPDNPYIFNGGAVIQDNNIIFSGAGSQEHVAPWRDSGIVQFRLDKLSLNGIFWSNYVSFNLSSREAKIEYAAGTLTLTTCQ